MPESERRRRLVLPMRFRREHARPWLGAALALLVLLTVWTYASAWYRQQLLVEEMAEARLETSLRASALAQSINRRFVRLQSLRAFVEAEAHTPDLDDSFEVFAAGLLENAPGVRTLALAPNGVIRHVFPLEDNQAVLGYEPGRDPRVSVRADVMRAIESRQPVLSGPTDLLQGGVGLIAREAIYVDGQYWGMANLVLDLPILLAEAGLDEAQTGELSFAVRDQAGILLHGHEDTFEENPVVSRIYLPDGIWELAGTPAMGWDEAIQRPLGVFQVTGLIIVGLLVVLVYVAINRQMSLERVVLQRTQEIEGINVRLKQDIVERKQVEAALREREGQYRSMFESVAEGLFINDLEGRLVDFNPAAARMHGYTPEEFRRLQPPDFIHPDSQPLFSAYIDAIKTGDQFRGRAVDVRKDGTLFDVEVFGTAFSYRGRPHTLAVVRDITEEVQAYQLLENRVRERTHELTTLLEITRNLASTLQLEEVLDLVLDQVRLLVEYDAASIQLVSSDRQSIQIVASRGYADPERVTGRIGPLSGRYPQEEVILTGRPLNLADVSGEKPTLDDPTLISARGWLGVPLRTQQRVIGMISLVRWRPGGFTEAEIGFAAAFADLAGLALENARLYQQSRQLAVIEERTRLARDLHDSVAQSLYSLVLFAEAAKRLVEGGRAGEGREFLVRLRETSQQCLKEMRLLVYQLRPPSLEAQGLIGALKERLDAVEKRSGLSVSLVLDESIQLPEEVEYELYWVAQEALNNALKHAAASSIEISLLEHEGTIEFGIRDDGRGFDLAVERESGGLGLTGIEERVQALAGELQILTAPGEGTRVRVQLTLGVRPAPMSMMQEAV